MLLNAGSDVLDEVRWQSLARRAGKGATMYIVIALGATKSNQWRLRGAKGLVLVKLLALLHRLYHRDTIPSCQSFEKFFMRSRLPAYAYQKPERKQNLPMQAEAGRAVMNGPRFSCPYACQYLICGC
jgi:hypothetical protein